MKSQQPTIKQATFQYFLIRLLKPIVRRIRCGLRVVFSQTHLEATVAEPQPGCDE